MNILKGVLLMSLLLSTFTYAAEPVSGIYWNPEQPGRGFPIDYQNGSLALTGYIYDEYGDPIWFLAAGRMTNDNTRLQATAEIYMDGQCIECPYRKPEVVDNLGEVDLKFYSPDQATLKIGNEVIELERQNFGFPAPPRSMLGKWYIIKELSPNFSFGSIYNFTNIGPPSGAEGGTGVFIDQASNAIGECFSSGELAGQCLLLSFGDDTDDLQKVYLYKQHIDRLYGIGLNHLSFEPNSRVVGFQLESSSIQPRSIDNKFKFTNP